MTVLEVVYSADAGHVSETRTSRYPLIYYLAAACASIDKYRLVFSPLLMCQ
jgi:hypothetical protein